MRGIIQILVLLASACFSSAVIKNKGWWKNTVFYQVYPRSFMDSDGDGIGDLNGVTSKLQHFVDIGVGAIWLSPIFTSPMVDFGYDISDFEDIDSIFGTMQDFEKLTSAAKKLGIKVILDLVPNHTSDQHNWFQKSLAGIGKYKDYYIWKDGKRANKDPPNNWLSVFSGPGWTYNATRGKWYFHQFEYRQPDLNYSNPEVRIEMENVIKFWLRKGVDGFRIDAVPHLFESDHLKDEPRSNDPNATPRDYSYLNHIYTKDDPRTYELVRSWREVMDDYADQHNEDEKVMMTEAYTSLVNTTKYYNYGSHVPFNFNFIMDASSSSTPKTFQRIIQDWLSHMPAGATANWVMGNHDRSRTASRYPETGDQMIILGMILPGVAVTYNGEEIGMLDKSDISWEDTQDPQACNAGKEKYKSRSRDPNRTPLQWDSTKNAGFSKANRTWLPVHENYKQLNLANQKVANRSAYKSYKALTTLRKTSDALKSGTTIVKELNDDKILCVGRVARSESLVLVMNFQNNSQTVDVSSCATFYKNTVIKVASLGSPHVEGTVINPKQLQLARKASVVIYSNTP